MRKEFQSNCCQFNKCKIAKNTKYKVKTTSEYLLEISLLFLFCFNDFFQHTFRHVQFLLRS